MVMSVVKNVGALVSNKNIAKRSIGYYLALLCKGVFLFVLVFMSLFPLYWTAVNSFRTNVQIFTVFRWFPEQFDFGAYNTLFSAGQVLTGLMNSTIVTGSVMLGSTFIILMAAYALSCYKFKAAPYFIVAFTAAMFIPGVTIMGTVYQMLAGMGLLGSRMGIVIIYTSGRLALSIFLMVAFMQSIPQAVQEAAVIDGCNSWSLFTRVVVPLSRNGIMVVLILTFIHIWNEYMWAMILLPTRSLRTLTVMLASFFRAEYTSDYAVLSAGVIIGTLPVMIVYLLLQEKIINGLVSASVKG